MSKTAKTIHWLWAHMPICRGKSYKMLDMERDFWKSQYRPIEEWKLRNEPIVANPESRNVRLMGPFNAEFEGKWQKYGGRYYLDYRFFAVKNSLSDLARQQIARDIHDDILRLLRGMKTEAGATDNQEVQRIMTSTGKARLKDARPLNERR